jgi:integrase-like protein
MASWTAAYGRACYQWANKRGSLAANPFQNLPLAPVAKRERVLTKEEMRAVWEATCGTGSFNAIVRMLMLTGQRREEVTAMTWNEIAPDLSTWTIPASRAKNGIAHIVPLSAQAQGILRAAPRIEREAAEEPGACVPGQRGPFSGFSKSKEALDGDSAVKDWRLHDLRRTMATGLQRLGVRLEVTEAVLNHVSGSRAGIVGAYQRQNWSDEKRAACGMGSARRGHCRGARVWRERHAVTSERLGTPLAAMARLSRRVSGRACLPFFCVAAALGEGLEPVASTARRGLGGCTSDVRGTAAGRPKRILWAASPPRP